MFPKLSWAVFFFSQNTSEAVWSVLVIHIFEMEVRKPDLFTFSPLPFFANASNRVTLESRPPVIFRRGRFIKHGMERTSYLLFCFNFYIFFKPPYRLSNMYTSCLKQSNWVLLPSSCDTATKSSLPKETVLPRQDRGLPEFVIQYPRHHRKQHTQRRAALKKLHGYVSQAILFRALVKSPEQLRKHFMWIPQAWVLAPWLEMRLDFPEKVIHLRLSHWFSLFCLFQAWAKLCHWPAANSWFLKKSDHIKGCKTGSMAIS